MKKIFAMAISAAIAVSGLACCIASGDEWKDNTGSIDLETLSVSGDGISVNGNEVLITSGGDFTVTGACESGTIRVNTEDKIKLRLSGMSLTGDGGPAIYFENTEKGFITVTEGTENYIADSETYAVEDADAALFSNDDLEIKGGGKLTVTGNYKHGIASDDDLSIENGTFIITSQEHGIKANDKVSVTGGDISVTAKTGKGIKAGKELVIDAGIVNIVSEQSEGIESKGTIVINGGDINITAADDGINTGMESTSGEAGEMPQFDRGNRGQMPQNGEAGEMPQFGGGNRGQMPQNGEAGEMSQFDRGNRGQMPQTGETGEMPQFGGGGRGQMPQNGETGEMPQFDRGNRGQMPQNGEAGEMPRFDRGNRGQMPQNGEAGEMPQLGGGGRGGFFGYIDEETAAAHSITINGGSIYINAKGDGIDSNGSLTIAGGNIVIDGPEMSGNGPLDSEGTMTITGGTVTTLSSAGMLQLPQNADGQNILRVYFEQSGTAGDVVSVKDSSGKEIVSHTAAQPYMALVYSAPELKEDGEYSIYVNGALYKQVTAEKGITSVGTATGGFMGGGMRMRQWNGMQGQNGAQKKVAVSLNGKTLDFDTDPVIKNDTTLVGFRSILEALGADVTWDEDTKTVTAEKDGISIKLVIDSDKAYVNGYEKKLLKAPEIINGSTMIPVRFVSENLNMNVEWVENESRVEITENESAL